jgi:RluA family pseudouridine synthase
MGLELQVIFEDESILVVDKPAGMVVDEVVKIFPGVILAHRLDRDTSGVMVLAKTEAAYAALKEQFLQRKVKKTYLALVHGEMKEKAGVISLPIEPNPKNSQKRVIGSDLARTAVTEWRVIGEMRKERGERLALLEVKPLTGRTHQIRVHLKHIGHPIVSDVLYGGRKQYKEDIKWCPRLWLHAKRLEFIYPTTGELVSFEVEVPAELIGVDSRLGALLF